MLSFRSLKPEFTNSTTIFFKGAAKSRGYHQIQTESHNEICNYSMNSKFGCTPVLRCFVGFWGVGWGLLRWQIINLEYFEN